jgi:hypothetical protein
MVIWQDLINDMLLFGCTCPSTFVAFSSHLPAPLLYFRERV